MTERMPPRAPRSARRALVGVLALVLAGPFLPLAHAQGPAPAAASAGTLRIAILTREDDERFDEKRAALAYPGHPGGHPETAVAVAIDETSFELDVARLQVRPETVNVRSAADVRAALGRLEQAGTAAVLIDLPAAWITPLWTGGATLATRMALFNIGSADDALRGAACHPALFHTLPAERMRSDAIAQFLVTRRFSRVLVLHGSGADDAARLAVVQASIKRFGLKPTAVKAFKLSADPRERDLANPALLTAPANAGGEYDVVWVVDSVGEFARSLNYRSALPRPLVGDGGLAALAWAPNFERFGAPQLSRRFARDAKRPMTAHDWAAWMATKAVLQAAMENPRENPRSPGGEALRRAMQRDGFVLDGFKGTRISFRPWDRQLRQPMLLTDGVGVIGSAPVDGILHPKNALDTLGVDAPETACKSAG
jgi:ABC transporter substrate binding protein (PQQ-dependent alcohol dehydrogenase system)